MRMKKTVSIILICLMILSAVPIGASAKGVNKSSLSFVRTGSFNTYMLNVKHRMAYDNTDIDKIIDVLNNEDEFYTEIDTLYTCYIVIMNEYGDYVTSGTLNGIADAYFRNNFTITFSGAITFPTYGLYNITAQIYNDHNIRVGTVCTELENYPIDSGYYHYSDKYLTDDEYFTDPDRYIFYDPYGYSLMNKLNNIREAYGLRPLAVREEGMELAKWRVGDLIRFNITDRRGLSDTYEAAGVYSTLYAEFFIQGAASVDEALGMLLSNDNSVYELLSDEYSRFAVSFAICSEGSIGYWAIELYR